MMNWNFGFVFIVAVLFSGTNYACTCLDSPETFSSDLTKDHVVLSASVLSHIDMSSEFNRHTFINSLTQLRVEKWYLNEMKVDTVYYANGEGSMCDQSLQGLKLGEKIILKANKLTLIRGVDDDGIEEDMEKVLKLINASEKAILCTFLAYHICDVNILHVQDDRVVGNITKNYFMEHWRMIRHIEKSNRVLSKKLEHWLTGNNDLKQVWNREEFDEFIKTLKN